MDYIFFVGILGSLILVTGAAWPESRRGSNPIKSIKNWLFALGAAAMLMYATLGYIEGEPIFFIFVQSLAIIASVLMMLNIKDTIVTIVISTIGISFILWSLYILEGINTIFFIIGLSGIGMGYAFETKTIRRNLALTLGSTLIALFSYIEASWVFFWLNTFFAIFSAYYLVKGLKKR